MISGSYYGNYLLDIYEWELSDKDKEILDVVIWIVDNRCSIRQASKEFVISKSSIHRNVHKRLKVISYELYRCVLRQFEMNKRRYFK